ncbi:MAG: hypothetical protein WCY19_01395 [Candidatus Gastranaerophilaceae bacterium]
MNDTFDTSLETNFSGKYNYGELVSLLSSDKDSEKHFAILELDEICSQQDAEVLVSNLVGQDGKIREATAFKISELTQNPEYVMFFKSEKIFDVLLQGIMDINGNVCRQIVNLTDNLGVSFKKYLCEKLPESINNILKEIEKIDLKSKQYVISKRNFQLYWCLDALYNIIDLIDFAKIKDALFVTGNFYDYTIREKTAKILTKSDNCEFDDLKEKLKNDDNYYVRRYLS